MTTQHCYHLVAGALQNQVALLNEVKGKLEVQVGALAQGLQVGAQLAEGGVVHLAVERDVVLDLWAAVDAVQDVALQVLVNGVILLLGVQIYTVKGELAGDVLHRGREEKMRGGVAGWALAEPALLLHLQGRSDRHHQLEPRWEPADGLGEEGHNGVAVVRLVELGLVQAVDEDDEVLVRVDLPV